MIFKSLLLVATGYLGYKIVSNNNDKSTTSPFVRKSSTFKNFSSTIDGDPKPSANPFIPVTPRHP